VSDGAADVIAPWGGREGKMAPDFDVVIIGARIAGATLAALLGDAGYRVPLADRARFPSDTLSTHFFRGGRAVAVLERLGVLSDALALGAPPLVRQYSYRDGGAEPAVQPPQEPGEIGYALSVRREPLDHLLVRRAAASSTVELLEGTRLAEMLWEDGRVVGGRLRTPAGERPVRARRLVGADGRHSTVGPAVGTAYEAWGPPHRALYYVYVRDFPAPHGGPADGAEFSRLEDEIAYVFPSDAGLTCLGISVGPEEYGRLRAGGLDRFRERMAAHRGLGPRLEAATVEGRLLGTGPEPSYVRVPAGPGWALVGDAGMHQDPWGGMGIDMGTTQAVALAEALDAWFGGRESEADALAAYHRWRNDSGMRFYQFVTRVGRDLRMLDQPAAPIT
jgi:2-polyprenyl-6-methoxyphenol hydroxylase-like FAD-dependent oxidoreductase